MRNLATRCVASGLGLLIATSMAMAERYGAPTLLPLPDDSAYPAYQTSYGTPQPHALGAPGENGVIEPVPTPMPDEASSPSPSDTTPYAAEAGAPAEGCTSGSCYDNTSCCDSDWMVPWCGPGCGGWFGSIGGLMLTRDQPNAFWTSYNSANNADQIMSTRDANADWQGGWLLSFGKWFGGCCNPCNPCGPRHGIGVTYFSTNPFQGTSTVNAPDPGAGQWVSSTMDLNDAGGAIAFPDGNEVDDYFDGSASQTIQRQDYIQSVEINFLTQYWRPNARTQVTWLAGVRWFRFDESLIYSAIAGQTTPVGSNYAAMRFDVTNDLVGAQLGARCDWYLTQRFSVFVTPQFGIFGNYIQSTNQVYNGDGSYLYDFQQHTNSISFLGQIAVGTSYQFSPHWRAYMGYMAIAATGIALSDNQIPHYLAAQDELQQIDRNGSLVVHGGFAGLEFCF